MTRAKIRQLELAVGAPPRKGVRGIAGNKNARTREAERELARQAESAYRRTIADWTASGPAKTGAGVTPGRASSRPSKGKAARQSPATVRRHWPKGRFRGERLHRFVCLPTNERPEA